MKKLSVFFIAISIMTSIVTVNAAPVPRESAPCNATKHQIIVAENLISGVLDEVKNGMGYAEARAKTNAIIFNAFLTGQTSGYSYGELTAIANNAIFQYRDMYLRPNFYIENEEKVREIIADVITQYANGEIDYTKAEFNARVKIYQSVNPAFNPDEELAKDTCYRDIPSVDNSLFTIARKLILEAKK
ncbi:MAG TPA: hypothetical protein DEP65_10420 [Ruminococcus sp.]|nr:hypothetical protein [Ruminococcus sp.]